MTFPRGSLAAAVVLTLASGALRSAAAFPQDPPAVAANESYSSKRYVEIPLDRSRVAGKKGAELWSSTDNGQTWVNHGDIDATKPSAAFLAPRDGRYGFLIVPLAADGRRETTPKTGDAAEKIIVVDTVPPVVEVLGPEMRSSGGRPSTMKSASDASLATLPARSRAVTRTRHVMLDSAGGMSQ